MSSLPHASGTKTCSTGRFTGQKRALKPREVWSIRIRLEIADKKRELALFNLAIDSKLRACDLVALRVEDVCIGGRVRDRAIIVQRKTGRPVQFEISELTRQSVQSWIATRGLRSGFLFPSRHHDCPHISTRQYARIVDRWVESAGRQDQSRAYHSVRNGVAHSEGRERTRHETRDKPQHCPDWPWSCVCGLNARHNR
jgi:integrase